MQPQSVAGSVKSQGAASQASRRSKVSKKSYVDETLFGNNSKKAAAPGPTTVTKEELRAIRERVGKGQQSDAVVIPKSELDRMKQAAVITTKEQQAETKKLFEEQKQQALHAAKARKKRMQEIDQQRQKEAPVRAEDKEKNETLLTKAKQMLDEELDEVKDMNKMMLYSKCVTIRDKQLEESKRLEDEWRTEQKAMDIMMEIERLKSLKAQEEIEIKKKEAQRNGARVIID